MIIIAVVVFMFERVWFDFWEAKRILLKNTVRIVILVVFRAITLTNNGCEELQVTVIEKRGLTIIATSASYCNDDDDHNTVVGIVITLIVNGSRPKKGPQRPKKGKHRPKNVPKGPKRHPKAQKTQRPKSPRQFLLKPLPICIAVTR